QNNLVLDGGNVVKWQNIAVVTDRVKKDNPELDETKIYSKLKYLLGVEKLIIIPELKNDMTGHSDGILRFISDDFVVLNDFSKIDEAYHSQLKSGLLNA